MDAKNLRNEIILNNGFRKYIRVKRALHTLVNHPENFVQLLANTKDDSVNIVIKILKSNKSLDEIRKLIELWTQLDKRYGGDVAHESKIN